MRTLLLPALILGFSATISAQSNRELIKGGDTGILITQTRIELSDARRIPTEPKIETPEVQHPVLSYSVSVNPAEVPATIQLPDAERMQKEKQPKYHHNYVKLGFGTNLSPLADIYITMPGKDGLLAFNYHFLGADGPGYMDFNSHKGGITGIKYFKKSNLEAGFHFNRRGFNYYGFDPLEYLPEEDKDIRQNYQDIGGRLAWESKPMGRNKTYFKVHSEFYNFSDKWKQNENWFSTTGIYQIDVLKNELHLEASYQLQNFVGPESLFNQGFDTIGFTRHFIDLKPHYTIRKKNWQLTLGFISTFTMQADQKVKFNFNPQVEGVYEVEPNQLSVFGGFNGQLQKNSFRQFAMQNPFLSMNPDLQVNMNTFNMEAGIRGKLTGNTGFVTKVRYSRWNDLPLFVMDTNNLRSFLVIHDDMALIQLNGQITHQYSEKFRMAFSFNYNFYTPNIQEAAWQLPKYEGKLNMTYNMSDKILLSFDGFVFGQRKAFRLQDDPKTQATTVKPLGDFNLGIDYRWKKQISAFMRLNNLLGQNYQIWYAHPTYSFNMHAGLAIGF